MMREIYDIFVANLEIPVLVIPSLIYRHTEKILASLVRDEDDGAIAVKSLF